MDVPERTGLKAKGKTSLHALLDRVRRTPETAHGGAIATFTGIVRGYTHEGAEVDRLEFDADPAAAEAALARIADDLRGRPGIVDVLIHHMIGTFSVGEELVYVVVVGESRDAAFRVLREAVERYKHDVPIWKKEYLNDGTSRWVT
jgi:molybdopterin synthase catalytic subunit